MMDSGNVFRARSVDPSAIAGQVGVGVPHYLPSRLDGTIGVLPHSPLSV